MVSPESNKLSRDSIGIGSQTPDISLQHTRLCTFMNFEPVCTCTSKICVCAHVCHDVCVWGGQRTTCGDRFFPSTVMVLGMNSGHRVWQQEPLLTTIPPAQEDSSYYLLILL